MLGSRASPEQHMLGDPAAVRWQDIPAQLFFSHSNMSPCACRYGEAISTTAATVQLLCRNWKQRWAEPVSGQRTCVCKGVSSGAALQTNRPGRGHARRQFAASFTGSCGGWALRLPQPRSPARPVLAPSNAGPVQVHGRRAAHGVHFEGGAGHDRSVRPMQSVPAISLAVRTTHTPSGVECARSLSKRHSCQVLGLGTP